MKALLFALALLVTASVTAQDKQKKPAKNKELVTVEAGCGQCQFKLKGSGCDLAVRMDGKAYFVDGSTIDEHGDAHAEDGFCNAIRPAQVRGKVVGDRFKATYFKLADEKEKKKD